MNRPALLFLFLLTLLAYHNSFSVPFLFDDALTIQRNSAVRLGEFHFHPEASRWLLYLTFTANYRLSGLDTSSYHVVNFGLHFLNGCLVFAICRRFTSQIPAFCGAAIFLLHPLQTESVTYISSRSELLSALFYLGAVACFAWRNTLIIGWRFSLLVGVLFFLALGSKETAITLPVAFLLYDGLFLSTVRQHWKFYAGFLAIGLLAAWHIRAVTLWSTLNATPGLLSPWHYFLTETTVIVRYLGLIVWPAGQNLDWDIPPSTSIDLIVAFSGVIIVSLLLWGWHIRKTQPLIAFGIFWFFVTLAPTSSMIPISDVMFEHRLYLPMVGVALVVAGLMAANEMISLGEAKSRQSGT